VDDSLQVAALPPAGAAEDAVEIVRGISVAKSIRHHEIDRFVAPIHARGADAAGRYGPEDDARRERETDHAGDSTAAPPASTVTSASPRGAATRAPERTSMSWREATGTRTCVFARPVFRTT